MIYIFYHGNCQDGEMSAAVTLDLIVQKKIINKAKEFFDNNFNTTFKYIPWSHHKKEEIHEIFSTLTQTDYLVFLDVSPRVDDISNYLQSKYMLIIDHHKNAVESIIEYCKDSEYVEIYHDPEYKMSGCMLTWKYFNYEKTYPAPLKYIGHLDIWDFSDEYSEPFDVAFKEFFKFGTHLTHMERIHLMRNVLFLDSEFITIIVNKGKELIKEMNIVARKILETTDSKILFDENNKKYKTLLVECIYVKYYKYIIDNARILFPDYDIIQISRINDNMICHSLRTINTNLSVDSIARRYGGNGHPQAAGYSEVL